MSSQHKSAILSLGEGPEITSKEYEFIGRRNLMQRIMTEEKEMLGFIAVIDEVIDAIEEELFDEEEEEDGAQGLEFNVLSELALKLRPYRGHWIHLP